MKHWFRCMVVAVGFLAWQSVAFADLPDPKGKTENPNVVAGRKAIDAKDYKGAVGHLTKAVQELPNDADAHSMLGYAYRKTERLRQIHGALSTGAQARLESSFRA